MQLTNKGYSVTLSDSSSNNIRQDDSGLFSFIPNWGDIFVGTVEGVTHAVLGALGNLVNYIGGYIPEIMACITVLAGVVIMLSGRVGKPIVWWAICLGVGVLWRVGI